MLKLDSNSTWGSAGSDASIARTPLDSTSPRSLVPRWPSRPPRPPLRRLLRLLPERDPHPALYEAAQILIAHLDDPFESTRRVVVLGEVEEL